MTYLTENPWPLLILLVVTGVVAVISGSSKGWLAAGICLLAAVGLFFLEQYVVTAREQVEIELNQMLTHFKNRDVDAIGGQICKESDELKSIAERGLEMVDLSESFHLSSVDVELNESEDTATAWVRANGDVTLRTHGGGSRHIPTFWKTTWTLEDGVWKLRDVIRLNPANGQEVGHFSAR
ncbi:MAG: hypothetical protein RIK87_03680 [Fuerstiella sp.]